MKKSELLVTKIVERTILSILRRIDDNAVA